MRNLGLDLLRLLAVVLVLGRHLTLPPEGLHVLQLWHRGGWVGVDLFFVLSGFLVSGLLYQEYRRHRRVHIIRFLARRALRIYPPFYILIAFTVIFLRTNDVAISPTGLWGEILFLQNYLGGLWNHTWSLAVEEHFYLGVACLFAWMVTRKGRGPDPFVHVPLVFAVVAACCLLLRVALLASGVPYSERAYLYPTHLRIDSLMYGVFIAYLWHFGDLAERIRVVPSALLVGLGALLLAPAFCCELEGNRLLTVFGVVSFYLGSGSLLLAAVRLRESKHRLLRLGGEFGSASYSIYLWHMPIALWVCPYVMHRLGIGRYDFYLMVYLGLTFICGWLMNKLVEWPVLRMREALFPNAWRA